MNLRKEILDEYGYQRGCPGCEGMLARQSLLGPAQIRARGFSVGRTRKVIRLQDRCMFHVFDGQQAFW